MFSLALPPKCGYSATRPPDRRRRQAVTSEEEQEFDGKSVEQVQDRGDPG